MAAHSIDLKREGRWAAALLLVLLGTCAWADERRVTKSNYDAKFLFEATQRLSADLGRPPTPAEWPAVLLEAPSTDEVWRGPYVGAIRRDAWGNPYLFRSDVAGPGTFGIYSVGKNGIDEAGAGDDVSSWQGYDSRLYPETRPSMLEWLFLGLPILLFAAMVLLVARYAFLAWRQWQSSSQQRSQTLLRVGMGAWFLFAGLNYWIEVVPQPYGVQPIASRFIGTLVATGLFDVIKALEVLTGLCLLVNRLTAVALLVALPISVVAAYFGVVLAFREKHRDCHCHARCAHRLDVQLPRLLSPVPGVAPHRVAVALITGPQRLPAPPLTIRSHFGIMSQRMRRHDEWNLIDLTSE